MRLFNFISIYSLIIGIGLISTPCLLKADAEQTEIFSHLPTDALAAIRISSVDQLSKNFNDFLFQAAQMKLPDVVEDYVKEPFDLENLKGIDTSKSHWAFLYWRDNNAKVFDKTFIVIYPLNNRDTFLKQFNVTPNGDSQYDNLTRRFYIKNGHALICDPALDWPVVEEWFEGWNTLNQQLSGDSQALGDLNLWINADKTMMRYGQGIQEDIETAMRSNNTEKGDTPGQMLPNMRTIWTLDLLYQIKLAQFSLSFSKQEAILQKTLIPKSRTPVSTFLQSIQPQTALKQEAFSDSWISVRIDTIPESLFELAEIRVLNDLSSLGFQISQISTLWDSIQKTLNHSAVGLVSLNENENRFYEAMNYFKISDTKSASQMMDTLTRMVKDYSDSLSKNSEIVCHVDFKRDAGQIDGQSYSTLSIQPDTKDPESPLSKEIARQNVNIEYAITPEYLIITYGQRDSNERIKNAIQFLPDLNDYISGSSNTNDSNSLATVRVDLLKQLKYIKWLIDKKLPVNPLAMVEVPNVETHGLYLNINAKDNALHGRLSLKSSDVLKVMMAFLGGGLSGF